MISIASPFYNESQVIDVFFGRVLPVMRDLGVPFEIVCVNDGSADDTQQQLLQAAKHHPQVRVVELSRNFGKEAALSAAIDHARGDAVVIIDADLQDPPELIPEMVALWQQGYEVVQARRVDRSSDGWAKRATARAFYRVHNWMADRPLPPDVGDFRLIDRRVVQALRQLPERRRFLKGLFSWVGFRTVTVDYARPARAAGTSKFTGWKLWNLALEGITAFSTWPLRVWTYVGVVVAFVSFAYAGFIIVRTLMHGVDVPGYASLLAVVLFLGGIQLIGLGVLGEYIGRIHAESKLRPLYLVRSDSAAPCADAPPGADPRST